MLQLRRETRRFRSRAVNSMVLAIELFNRPHEGGRTEVVLLLLQHAFEMLLKAAIFQKRGTIFDKGEGLSHRFNRCLTIARSDIGILDADQVSTLAILEGLRNFAAHNLIDLTEQVFYLHSQAAVTLFDQVLQKGFDDRLAHHVPSRVLPISSEPPRDMMALIDSEFSQIQALLSYGRRRGAEARGRIRHLMVMESNLSADGLQPTDRQVDRVVQQVKEGLVWQKLFPGVATLRLETHGHGAGVSIRFTRDAGAAPVRVLRPGHPSIEEASLFREVNLWDRYSLGLRAIAPKVGLSEAKSLALIKHLGLQNDEACYKEFRIGSTIYKRYTPNVLDLLNKAKIELDMGLIWEQQRPRGGKKPVL